MSSRPLWHRHQARDADKLGAELALGRRGFIKGLSTAALVAAVDEYVGLRRANAMFVHGGGQSVTAITNARTGTTYQFLCDAIYTASSGDTILIPAGSYAPAFPSTPYSHWQQLASNLRGPPYTSRFNTMYITTPISLVGVGSANNGRAAISMPFCTLSADWNPGDTILHLVDATLIPSAANNASMYAGFQGLWIWGQGTALSYAELTAGHNFSYTGISGNDLTGVTSSTSSIVPSGTTLFLPPINGQAPFASFAVNPGITFQNIEIFGAVFGSQSCNPVRMGNSSPGQPETSSVTFTNCYLHDCAMGPGNGNGPFGNSTFAHFFGTEVYRMGAPIGAAGSTHNIYIGPNSELIFDGSYSHFTQWGAMLLKTRCFTNYITYSRISGERTDSGNPNADASNIDLTNGGLTYIIGCALEQSLNASNQMVQNANDPPDEGQLFADHPLQEIYAINNTMIGPSNGTGWNGGTGPATGLSDAPLITWRPGLLWPEMPLMGSSVAGSLGARTYFAVASCIDGSGNESAGSSLGGARRVLSADQTAADGNAAVVNYLPIAANSVATVASPVPRTAAVNWDVYANYADPRPYLSGSFPPPQSGNSYFWDAGFTLPIFSEAAGGSNPTMYVYWAFTYQFATGESVNAALYAGAWFIGWGPHDAFTPYYLLGDRSTQDTTRLDVLVGYQIDANKVVSIASPPSVAGATGWNVYAVVLAYAGGSTVAVTPLSKQNTSGPISLGTAWTEPTSGLVVSADILPNLLRQNASPIAMGTGWTEPTSGLTNHNPSASKLKWRQRGTPNDAPFNIFSEWWAVAPTPGTYSIDIYQNFTDLSAGTTAVIVAVKGATSTTFPFDAGLIANGVNTPVVEGSTPSTPSITTSATNTVLVAAYRGTGTAGAGFTQIGSNPNLVNGEYKVLSGATTTNVPQTGGSTSDAFLGDAIVVGVGGGVDATATGTAASPSPKLTVSITTTQSNDILVAFITTLGVSGIGAIDQIGPPPISQITTGAPLGSFQNNITAYFNPAQTGGYVCQPGRTFPTGTITVGANNLQASPFNGSTFRAPLVSAVMTDTPNYNYTLIVGSPAIGAGANPGSNPYPTNPIGANLQPHYELKLFGLPTPGTPIPSKTARPNTGGVYDVGAFELGI